MQCVGAEQSSWKTRGKGLSCTLLWALVVLLRNAVLLFVFKPFLWEERPCDSMGPLHGFSQGSDPSFSPPPICCCSCLSHPPSPFLLVPEVAAFLKFHVVIGCAGCVCCFPK